jgi:cyclic-di-AMP phosphodiesterase PgpH
MLRRAALALEEAPERHWAALLVHHGGRALLLVVVSVAVYLFFPAPRLPDAAVLERGVVAPTDIIAEFTFPIPKTEVELLREQAEAASGVPPVLDYHPAAMGELVGSVRALFAGIDSTVVHSEPDTRREALHDFLTPRLPLTSEMVGVLMRAQDRRELQRSIELVVEEAFPRGVVAPTLAREGASAFLVRGVGTAERLVPRDSVITLDRFLTLAAGRLPNAATPEMVELQRLILIRFFQPSLNLNEAATEAARARARDAVDPIRSMVLEGEKIVGAREQIGEREEDRLRAYRAAMSDRGFGDEGLQALGPAVGAVLYNILVLTILGVLLFLFRRGLYHDFRSIFLLAVLVVTVAGAASLIARFGLPPETIPVTFAALIVAALWDGRLGLSLALVLALLIGGQTPFAGVTAPFTAAIGGAAAAFAVRVVQRRSKTWLFVSIITLSYAASAITMGLLRSRELTEVLGSMGWGAVNAVVASLLAIGFLPLFEGFTRITTDQTLLELSDLNRKLLKRLSFEASGTYHHTINVANLAEAACHGIGANGLLARVGAYYHDIGKLVKPQYFVENQPKGRNPHDKLKPAMSASIIRSHVSEGLRLAAEEGLPVVVKDFIAQHHGTQQISFFLDRAREIDPDVQINPLDYSYDGPVPQTKETAVLMLADSVESAARVLHEPSAERLRELVERIVAMKMAHGQLDEAPLTLRDIEVVKVQLVNVLTGMYHHRIDYPPAPAAIPDETPEEAEALNLASTS